MEGRYDIAIIGAGMAGASLAAALDGKARVLLAEAEDVPGYHTTGRSAAFWMESYGGAGMQPLTLASRGPLEALGALTPRTALTLAKAGQEAALQAFAAPFRALGVEMPDLDRAEIAARVPGLHLDWTCGVLEPSCCDIDVARVHQHYLAQARRDDVDLWTRARLASAERSRDGWALTFEDGRKARAAVLVNAAGAWADPVARLAGVRPLGITPLRRTMAQVAVAPATTAALPLVLDLDGSFYFKPESGGIWLSPHDETPSAPCDAAPDKADVSLALDRLSCVVDWRVERVERRWAGLRSFAPDRMAVYGFDPRDPAFFWFAGQGGFGIQTAPAAAQLGAGLLLGEDSCNLDPMPYSPARFA
ncbi:NAD(P)/FAD-dependent oxidoreductase [Novosphingobium sp. 9]|uniref:NAD(P)/FAD-dependent oxidoreductase n=1 Tax=Novosphingobium sp. 9 TaxID=2025349 RepID=UPI0021B5FBAF|nr:FAD-dependent oxidoreductase [Novosphingobium sp. 9]